MYYYCLVLLLLVCDYNQRLMYCPFGPCANPSLDYGGESYSDSYYFSVAVVVVGLSAEPPAPGQKEVSIAGRARMQISLRDLALPALSVRRCNSSFRITARDIAMAT